MTWTYTVQDNRYKKGEYEGELKNVYRKVWQDVSKIVIEWRIFSPEEYLGDTLPQNFNVEHTNPETRRIAKDQFNRIAKQIKEIPIGKELTEEELFKLMVGKRAKLEIVPEGEYTNIKKVTIIDEPSPAYGVSLPVKPEKTGHPPLNDEVPF